MKHTKRKLLSLLLALAVMCSMVPAAMAAGSISLTVGQTTRLTSSYAGTSGLIYGYVWTSSDDSVVSVVSDSIDPVNGLGAASATIRAVSEGTATISAQTMYLGQEFGPEGVDSWTVTVSKPASGISTGTYCYLTSASMSLNVGGSSALKVSPVSGCTINSVIWNSTSSAVEISSNTGDSIIVTGAAIGNAAVTATISVKDPLGAFHTESLYCNVYVSSGSIGNTGDLNMSTSTLQLQPSGTPGVLSVTSYTYGSSLNNVIWSSSNTSVAQVASTTGSGYAMGPSVYVYGLASGKTTITATLYNNASQVLATAYCLVTVGSGTTTGTDSGHFYISASSLQLEPNGSYTQLTATPYANSGISLSNLNKLTWYSSNPTVANVYSATSSASGYVTGPSVYVSGLAVGKATITAYLDSSHYATCEITVGSGSGSIDILYSLTTGQSKTLSASDFTSFWNSASGKWDTLDYVVFGAASGSVGKLVYTTNNFTGSQNTVTSGTRFYVNPANGQYGISSVSFVPTQSANRYTTGTLAVPFTAYGSSTYYGVSNSRSGMLYITVTNGEVQAISYQTTNTAVKLNSTDFLNVYKKAFSTTAASAVYIQFLDVPTSGALYYNYNASSYSSGVKLTAGNIGSMRFGTNTTGSYSINALTYVPSTTSKNGDTVRYAAYSAASGGTLLYVGEINFGVKAASPVKFYGATNGTVKLSSATFFASDALAYTEYITFGTPSSGALYKNYSNGKGTKVSGGETFTLGTTGTTNIPSVNSLTFVPKAGFSGVVEIPFTCANILGGQASGTVKIYIAKTFTDVPSNHWAYGYVTQLTAEGIVNGMTETTFAPNQNLKYGEALKLIMEAVGYTKLEKTGTHWASGYLSRAYRDGLVSSANINLESYIDRNTVASITAKALGLSKATSINSGITGPSDSTDGYVYALYNVGILEGENRNGKNYYDGSSTLTRAQVCAIVCRVSEYDK